MQTDEQTWKKKKRTNKKQGKCCIILIRISRCGGMKQELQNIHMNNGHLRDLVNVLKTWNAFCFCSLLLSFSLFLSAFFLSIWCGNLEEDIEDWDARPQWEGGGYVCVCGAWAGDSEGCVWDTYQDHSPIWLYILPHQGSLRPLNLSSSGENNLSHLSFLDAMFSKFLSIQGLFQVFVICFKGLYFAFGVHHIR